MSCGKRRSADRLCQAVEEGSSKDAANCAWSFVHMIDSDTKMLLKRCHLPSDAELCNKHCSRLECVLAISSNTLIDANCYYINATMGKKVVQHAQRDGAVLPAAECNCKRTFDFLLSHFSFNLLFDVSEEVCLAKVKP